MKKEIRQFKLYNPVMDVQKDTLLLPAMIPTFGIFHFNEENHLKKIITYDLDGRAIQVFFANVFASTSETFFNSLEDVNSEIDRLRKEEMGLPRIAAEEEGKMIDIFSRQASLLADMRVAVQYKIVLSKFNKMMEEETE